MTDNDDTTDFLVRIGAFRNDLKAYPVEGTINGESLFYGGTLKLNVEKLLEWETDNDVYGKELLQALFSEPIKRGYERAYGQAEKCSEGRMRFRLQIDDDAASLHAVRWERLYARIKGSEMPLAISNLTSFSRFSGLEQATAPPVTERPIRIVFAISNPEGLPHGLEPIDVDEEVRQIHKSLKDLPSKQQIRVSIFPGRTGLSSLLKKQLEADGFMIEGTFTSLDSILQLMKECHVFHFLGHGGFTPGDIQGTGTTALLLEAKNGSSQWVKDDDLIPQLTGASSLPHLIFLAACESGKRPETIKQPFVGLAPKLVKAGAPAVVAMQANVPMKLATELTRRFYSTLLQHGVIDQALNDARLFLFDSKQADWSIPALFMRTEQGRLFTPNPVLSALEAIREECDLALAGMDNPLPVEVVHVTSGMDFDNWDPFAISGEAGLEFSDAIQNVFSKNSTLKTRFAVLLGQAGTAKTTCLRFLARSLITKTLEGNTGPTSIPLYVDISRFINVKTGFSFTFEAFLFEFFKPFWPHLDAAGFALMLQDASAPAFSFFLDGSDDLTDPQRIEIWGKISKFVSKCSRHHYLLTSDHGHFSPQRLPAATDILVIKPMSKAKIKTFLDSAVDPLATKLYKALEEKNLFDLAGLPWLLIRMQSQARSGFFPKSRTAVLQSLLEETLASVPEDQGMRARVDTTLVALAWEMHSKRLKSLAVGEVLRLMALERNNREYSLEALVNELTKLRILSKGGQECLRFSYPAIQAYCCAKAISKMNNQEDELDDITATFGRLSRLRWWEDTLVLLSGMLDKVDPLIRLILYGGSLNEGEKIFLAARCLQECGRSKVSDELFDQVTDSLIWRSKAKNEPRLKLRQRAIFSLEQLQALRAVPHLLDFAIGKVRPNWKGQLDFEHSSIRLAAVKALSHYEFKSPKDILGLVNFDIVSGIIEYSDFVKLLPSWFQQDVTKLGELLSSEDATTQTLAAFLLGNIGSEEATEVLIDAFLSPKLSGQMRWALADSLALLDSTIVTNRAILPFIDEEVAQKINIDPDVWRKRQYCYEKIVYLVGKIKPLDIRIHAFLDKCLYEYKSPWLKARTIRAIGGMKKQSYKKLIEQIAQEDFSNITLSETFNPEESMYLRSVAIETLAELGDKNTIKKLRKMKVPELLEPIIYTTIEEIYWRVSD